MLAMLLKLRLFRQLRLLGLEPTDLTSLSEDRFSLSSMSEWLSRISVRAKKNWFSSNNFKIYINHVIVSSNTIHSIFCFGLRERDLAVQWGV